MQVVSATSLAANLNINQAGAYAFQVSNPNGERSNTAKVSSQGILSGVTFEGVRLTDVTAGFPGAAFADVASFQMRNGTWRLFFDAGGAMRLATSPDGLGLTVLAGTAIPTRLPDGTSLRPSLVKVLRLDSGQIRVYFSSSNMYSAISNDDGVTFVTENGVRLAASAVGAPTITAGSIVRAGAQWRMYFADANHVYSAVSSDLLTWNVEPGVRMGPGAALSVSAEHPCAIVNADGSVSVFMFHGPTSLNPAPGIGGIYVATSPDGLTFPKEVWTGVASGNDPDVVPVSGGLRMYYNWGDGGGGAIYSARLPLLSSSLASSFVLMK